ncbi:DNA-binding transcriptional regulator, LysR family [Cohaesibacter sp. ES.047]|uniref:LysR family transcriptional regulator n=1 Tax=Cohaesibacter sp. ES.047 TaxID=1798205 RepID=UPI000BB73916|nr:LysR family transcriptional regulator [Cohaesibacter sp. ES.047]SNY92375.1 DNA-binding transcriptional regulator, LysR family [Cohaesibacter sp. ES.047]
MAIDRNLFAFLAVAETGNLTAAAEQLHLAQPSLTKRLKLLEDEYGARLFERHPRGMTLTPVGRVLMDHAKRIEQRYIQAREAIDAEKTNKLERLKIGAGPLFQRALLANAFDTLRQEFPETLLELRADVHEQNLPLLRHGHLDVVFGALITEIDEDDIEAIGLLKVHLGALAHLDHALHGKTSVTIRDLAACPWILYSNDKDTSSMVRGYFVRNGLTPPTFSIRTSSYEFGLDMVAKGNYIMPIPAELDQFLRPSGMRVLPLDEPIDRFISGAYVRSSTLAYPVVRRLLELIRQKANELQIQLTPKL